MREPPPVQTRRLAGDDVLALAQLFARNNVPEVVRFFHPFPLTPASAERLCGCAAETRDIYGVSFRGSRLIALYMLRGWDEGFAVPSFGILVDQECHGFGFGRQLTSIALEEARARGATFVRLTVMEQNVSAVRLYRSLGFEQIEQRVDSSGPVLVMRRDLRLLSSSRQS